MMGEVSDLAFATTKAEHMYLRCKIKLTSYYLSQVPYSTSVVCLPHIYTP